MGGGLFEAASAVLISRTEAPDIPSLTQHEAVRDALGGGVDDPPAPGVIAGAAERRGPRAREPGGGAVRARNSPADPFLSFCISRASFILFICLRICSA